MNNQLVKTVCANVARQYKRVSPVDNISWANEKVHVMTLLKQKPALQKVTQDSLQDALLQSASLGLTLNPAKQHCFIIPRKMRRKRKGESDQEYAQVPSFAYASPSYRGLSHLAVDSGAVEFIRAEVIFADDHFIYNGPVDKPDYKGHSVQTKKRQERFATGVYAIAKTKSGDWLCEYIDRETIQKIRNMSEMPDGSIWNPEKLWTEGWKKSVIRRLYKTLPDSNPRLDNAVELLNKYEGVAVNDKQQTEEKEVEAVVVISDEQSLELHALLTDNGIEGDDTTRWLTRLAKRFGVDDYKNIPADSFDDAKTILNTGLQNRK